MKTKTQSGFIALISTVIISSFLMMLTFSSSTSSFFARFDVLGNEFRKMSSNLSLSCANVALLKIAKDYNYTPIAGGEVINVGENFCKIYSVTYEAEDPITHQKLATITTSAQYPAPNGSFSRIRVSASVQNPMYLEINRPSISIKSWYDI